MTRRPGDTATPRAKAETVAILVGFALYAAFALKLLLFSRVPGSERSFNLVPFASITTYAFPHSPATKRAAFANVTGNILIFIPLGLLRILAPPSGGRVADARLGGSEARRLGAPELESPNCPQDGLNYIKYRLNIQFRRVCEDFWCPPSSTLTESSALCQRLW